MLNIRPFLSDDIQACATLHKASRRESEKNVIMDCDLDRYDLDHFVKNWTEWSQYKETKILIAEKDNKIIGFILFGKIRTRPNFDRGVVPRYSAEIYALYVHPDHFRQGVGKALFARACLNLIDQKLTSMVLWAFEKNKRACDFYESMGGQRIAKQRIDIGEKSWAEESCFGWRDLRQMTFN